MMKYGPYSKAITLAKPDGRTKEGRLLRMFKRQLFTHFGGERKVNLPQRVLIERCAQLQLRLSKFEEKAINGEWTSLDDRTYTMFSNSLTRTLAQLGIGGSPQQHKAKQPPSLSELFP